MALPTITLINQALPIGQTIIGPFAVPAGITQVQITTQTTWPAVEAGLVATVSLEFSDDGGVTWAPRFQAQYAGGLNSRTGLPPPGPSPSIKFDPPIPAGVQGRWLLTMTVPLLFTSVTVTGS